MFSMDKSKINALVEAATELVKLNGDNQNHTVASAAYTIAGKILVSLNQYHFTGGPCAELALMARLATEKEEPAIMVAVGNRSRGVLAPCGRCRQALFDYYPDLEIVIFENGQYLTKSIRELLPYAYSWDEQQFN